MEYLLYIIGGLVAGIMTGLVGLSAAVVIAPLFATFLGMDPYIAIGIALASDVFASSVSAYTYYKNKNIDIKKAKYLAIPIIICVIIASYYSKNTDPYNLNSAINIFVVVLGLRFFIYPVTSSKSNPLIKGDKAIIIQSIVWGIIIGLISGWFGSGGGLSMLAVLTMLLGYGLKKAIGTSVFIMVFTALFGAVTHIVIGGTFILPLLITSVTALIGAQLASIYANKIDEVKLNKIIGTFLIIYGAALVVVFYV